ncbi:LOW QUALITY PROTEIN: uncharacterized protein LOC143302355 [Babylonia areolata]|uniref:LOW QUALITY PROTEIN: uncharacterized protein LOC143302355 n=1 Tax=Babylonia areolata TaxID=304850 RepID=UPI003FD1734F
MALVTLQRSPSPSNDPDEESAEGTEEGSDGKSSVHRKRSKSTLEKLRKIFSTVRFISKLRPCLSESYFTVKGAALILPHNDLNRKTSRKNHGGEIQRHLQSMLYLLRPEDKIKVAIRLESQQENEHRYMALVSTTGRQDTEECVLLGLDCTTTLHPTTTTTATASPASSSTPATPPSSPVLTVPGGGGGGGGASGGSMGGSSHSSSHFEGRGGGGGGGMGLAAIGMVLPIWMGMKIRLNGDGGFAIVMDDKAYLFKPVSVQAMWTAIHSVDRAVHQAEQTKYLPDGLTHTWVEYYRSKVDHSNQTRLAAWHLIEGVEIFAPANLNFSNENEQEKVKLTISAKLKEVMMTVDLDEATCRSLRLEVEEALNMKLDEYRNYFDEELIRILGQMDAPSRILDFLYLGSEWNASNLEELQQLGIKYILNITREIDNFFTGMFQYCNVRLYDQEDSELMKHWLKTYKFINRAKKHGSKVLVHCKMGISRSASTVIAYLMKENQWSLDEAFAFVKERRSCIRPNKGFMEQLQTYEGILNASNKRHIFRSKSEHDLLDGAEGEEVEGGQQGIFLGDSLFRIMSGSDWAAQPLSPEEEILLRKSTDHSYTGMEPDFETDSRSADSMEESLPDMPSPLTEQPPVSLPCPVPTARPAGGEKKDPSPRPTSQTLTVEAPGTSSRIKSDTSWIKLELPGESSTDPEAMEVKEGEDQTADGGRGVKDSEQGHPSPTTTTTSDKSRAVFVVGSEAEAEASSQARCESGGDGGGGDGGGENREDPPPAEGEADQKGSGRVRPGRPQYYNREQIPWNPGKVRNLREGFAQSAPTTTAASSPPPDGAAKCHEMNAVPSAVCGSAEQVCEEAKKGVVEDSGQGDDNTPRAPLSVGGAELPQAGGHGPAGECPTTVDEESMDTDEQARRVYELEDVLVTPGTVRRTLQEIEERQKLQGDDTDSGAKSVKRSSSLREERETNKDRDSERRKTCTPIVSPPPEKASEVAEEEEEAKVERVEGEGGVFRLDHHVGESSTDDVEDMEGGRTEGCAGVEEEGEEAGVTVYTFGEETVPVKAGIVRRQKQEIENKSSWESHHHSLLHGSTGSVASLEDPERTGGRWPPDHSHPHHHHPPEAMTLGAEDTFEPGSVSVNVVTPDPSLGHAHHIPCAQLCTPPSPAAPLEVGECGGREGSRTPQQQQFMSGGAWRKPGQESVTDSSREDGRPQAAVPHALERHHHHQQHCSDPAEEDHWEEGGTSKFPFRPYAHSFPSTRRPTKECHYDQETLAMIREIGSTFVSSPPRREEEDSQGGTSLVRHLVKTIEKETHKPKLERKIVIIDSDSGQAGGKKPSTKAELGSSLFTPSPDFLSNIERQLSQPSQQPVSLPHPADCSGQPVVLEERRIMPQSSAEACMAGSSPPSCVGLGEGGEQALSVVKHLRGRFEGSGVHCDSSDGEVSLASASHTAPSACVDDGSRSVVMREKKKPWVVTSRSVEEHRVSDAPESQPHYQVSYSATASTSEPSRLSRRPRSADHATYLTSGTPRVQELEVADGVKVRKLHGKSHPLSRLQQQKQQGEAAFPPSLQRHSPSHSSM